MNHELKIQPQYFEAVANRTKQFEIRFNDRGFQVGDVLILREYDNGEYTGRSLSADVIYITDYCQQPHYVVMGIRH